MIHWKYNMLNMQDKKNTTFYRQTEKINNFCNCLIEKDIVDINSLNITFDNCYNVVPSKLDFYDGKYVTTYTDLRLVKIVDDVDLNDTYDTDNVLLLYYNGDYVKKNYKNLINIKQSLKSLVGKYIIDWKYNNMLRNVLSEMSAEYIQLIYCIYV